MSLRDSLQLHYYVYAFFSFFSVKKNELKGVAKEVTGKDIVKNLLKYTWPRGRSSHGLRAHSKSVDRTDC